MIRLTEEVRHKPIVAKHEDIGLPKKKLKKDILYRTGLEEGKQNRTKVGFRHK